MPVLLPRHTIRSPHGYATLTDTADGSQQEFDTLTCAHCHMLWHVEPGSGIKRGWCLKCAGATCGRLWCERRGCLPYEKEIEEIERKAQIVKRIRANGDVPDATLILG